MTNTYYFSGEHGDDVFLKRGGATIESCAFGGDLGVLDSGLVHQGLAIIDVAVFEPVDFVSCFGATVLIAPVA